MCKISKLGTYRVLFHFVRYALHLTDLTRNATPCNAICQVALLTFVRYVRYVRYEISVRERKTYKTEGLYFHILFIKPSNHDFFNYILMVKAFQVPGLVLRRETERGNKPRSIVEHGACKSQRGGG